MSVRTDSAVTAERRAAGHGWRRGLVYVPVALAYLFIVALLVAPPSRWLPITTGLQVTAASVTK